MPLDQINSATSGATSTLGLGSLNTLTNVLQGGLSNMLNMGSSILDRILPPAQREALKQKLTRFTTEKPYLASFLLSQIAFSGLPMFLFVIMVLSIAIFALLTGLLVGLLGAVLFILAAVGFALLILLPTLFFTTFAAVGVWLFGVGSYYLIRHFNKQDVAGVHSNKNNDGGSTGVGGAGVPGLNGATKATGLDGLVSGVGLGDVAKGQGQGQGQGQKKQESEKEKEKSHDTTTKPTQVNGSVEKQRPAKEKESKTKHQSADEVGIAQPVKRKTSVDKEQAEARSPAGHIKNTASGVGGAVNGIKNAVGVGV